MVAVFVFDVNWFVPFAVRCQLLLLLVVGVVCCLMLAVACCLLVDGCVFVVA